jgi:hypothetical protein
MPKKTYVSREVYDEVVRFIATPIYPPEIFRTARRTFESRMLELGISLKDAYGYVNLYWLGLLEPIPLVIPWYRVMKGIMYYKTEKAKERQTPDPFAFLAVYVYTQHPEDYSEKEFDRILDEMEDFVWSIGYAVDEGYAIKEVHALEKREIDEDEIKIFRAEKPTEQPRPETLEKFIETRTFEERDAERDKLYGYILIYQKGWGIKAEYLYDPDKKEFMRLK